MANENPACWQGTCHHRCLGAYGGATVDFRKLANRGMVLLGMTEAYNSGVISIADDLAKNIAVGDANYLAICRS